MNYKDAEEEIDDNDVLMVVAVLVGVGVAGFALAGGIVWGVMEIFGLI